MLNAYLIDDDHVIIEGLKFLFESDNEITISGSSTTLKQALTEIQHPGIDVVILDLNLRISEPIVNVQSLRKKFPMIPLVIFSGDDHIDSKIAMFNEGVSAYMVKSPELEEMRATIKSTVQGNKVIPSDVLSIMNTESSIKNGDNITIREKFVLEQLTIGKRFADIGETMCLSADAVRKIVDLLKDRYDCNTKEQLLTILLRLKVI